MRWQPTRPLFDPVRHYVGALAEKEAKAFVETHHYSHSYPAARIRVGLFEWVDGVGDCLVGAAVFSVPMNERVLPKWLGIGYPEGTELGRFVCTDDVGYNGETWFLAQALWWAREQHGIRRVLAYADPEAREGKRAHLGQIYRASNAIEVGRSTARMHHVGPNGALISERAISHVRDHDIRWEYAYRSMVGTGLPELLPEETPPEWWTRVKPQVVRRKHPGNIAFVFGLDKRERRALQTMWAQEAAA